MGLCCSKCGSRTQVQRCSDDEHRTVRIRECKQCGNLEISVEIYLCEMQHGFEYLAKKILLRSENRT